MFAFRPDVLDAAGAAPRKSRGNRKSGKSARSATMAWPRRRGERTAPAALIREGDEAGAKPSALAVTRESTTRPICLV